MSKNRRMRVAMATTLSAVGLAAAMVTAAPALPRRDVVVEPPVTTRPPVSTTRPPTTILPPSALVRRIPRYKIEALNFTARQESNWWPGSDEPYWIFTWSDGKQTVQKTSQVFGDVDEDETHHFGFTCLVAACSTGAAAPMGMTIQLFETDGFSDPQGAAKLTRQAIDAAIAKGCASFPEYCLAGKTIVQVLNALGFDLGAELDSFLAGLFGDDVLGSQVLSWQQADFDKANLTAPGKVYIEEFPVGPYTLRLKITRLADELVPVLSALSTR